MPRTLLEHNFIKLFKRFRNSLEKFYSFLSEPQFDKVQSVLEKNA